MTKIAIEGTGYEGLVTGTCCAAPGNKVTGGDIQSRDGVFVNHFITIESLIIIIKKNSDFLRYLQKLINKEVVGAHFINRCGLDQLTYISIQPCRKYHCQHPIGG